MFKNSVNIRISLILKWNTDWLTYIVGCKILSNTTIVGIWKFRSIVLIVEQIVNIHVVNIPLDVL